MNQFLLVEGKDDQHVIWALCKRFNLPQNFEVVETDGVDMLFKQLPVRLKAADTTTIGIIIDADMDINQRWTTIKTILQNKFPTFPEQPTPTGTIFQKKDMKVGVWLMPDNQANGMLESFIDFLIPNDDKLRPFLNAQLNDMERNNLHKYRPIHRDKAFIHSWLAVQKDPGTPMGLSITKRYLSTDVEQCQRLIRWLKDLFN